MMSRWNYWHTSLVTLLSIALVLGSPVASAQEAAGPRGQTSDVHAWRVADTRQLDIDGEPISLSPDGQWIAGLGPDNEFCVWDIAELTPVCTPDRYPVDAGSIAWAPDSSAIAFSLEFARLFTESDIFVFEVGSGELSNLTDDGIDDDTPMTELGDATEPVPVDAYPAWSLDGRELTFARTDWMAETRSTTLMTVSAAGGEPTELIELETVYPLLINSPMRWLEDGSLLYTIWTSVPDEPDDGLWIYKPGGEPVQLLGGTRADDYPAPLATDVYERDGTTVILGFSVFLSSNVTESRDRSIGFALALESGAAVPLEEFLSIDNTGAALGEETLIFAPPRLSPDETAIVLGIQQLGAGTQTLAIAPIDTGQPPVSIDVEPGFKPYAAFNGYAWANNNTILVPTAERADVLLTLERSADATPAAACSCTLPPRE